MVKRELEKKGKAKSADIVFGVNDFNPDKNCFSFRLFDVHVHKIECSSYDEKNYMFYVSSGPITFFVRRTSGRASKFFSTSMMTGAHTEKDFFNVATAPSISKLMQKASLLTNVVGDYDGEANPYVGKKYILTEGLRDDDLEKLRKYCDFVVVLR